MLHFCFDLITVFHLLENFRQNSLAICQTEGVWPFSTLLYFLFEKFCSVCVWSTGFRGGKPFCSLQWLTDAWTRAISLACLCEHGVSVPRGSAGRGDAAIHWPQRMEAGMEVCHARARLLPQHRGTLASVSLPDQFPNLNFLCRAQQHSQLFYSSSSSSGPPPVPFPAVCWAPWDALGSWVQLCCWLSPGAEGSLVASPPAATPDLLECRGTQSAARGALCPSSGLSVPTASV